MYNLDNCSLSDKNGSYGGNAGLKEGIIFENKYWLVKYPKSTRSMKSVKDSYTSSPLSEYIGSHIYQILGINTHNTILGIRNKKLVVACEDFCVNGYELREFRTIRNIYNAKLEEDLINENISDSNNNVDLKELLVQLDNNPILTSVKDFRELLFDMMIVDGLINNNDRNKGNFGLLYKNGQYSLAPVFDNGASFYNKISDEQIEKRLKDYNALIQSFLYTQTVYSLNDVELKFRDLINLDNYDIKKAIIRMTPIIKDKMLEIKKFIDNIPLEYEGYKIISKERKEYYYKSMEERLNKLIIPRYNELKNLPK